MRQLLRITFIISFLVLSSGTRAELLVVKKTNEGFAPLSLEEDATASPKIAEILLKYQWPMCIASNLTKEEQDELFTPGKPYAEELFIQKKIREAMKSDDYCVVFVPTTLYEMFCIYEFFKTEEGTPFWNSAIKDFDRGMGKGIYLSEIISSKASPRVIRKQIAEVYSEANKIFFSGDISASFYINHVMGKYFLERYPELKRSENSLEFSKHIKDMIIDAFWLDSFIEFKVDLDVFGKKLDIDWKIFATSRTMNPRTRLEKVSYNILGDFLPLNVISLEYEARERNKAMIIRGTSFEKFQVSFGEKPLKKVLIGGTLIKQEKKKVGNWKDTDVSLEEAYGEKKNTSYSISFGNSLLAGALGDETACVYNFLRGLNPFGSYDQDAFRSIQISGYAILIDKKAYVEHQINNLFFIPSLATLPALFARGEYFHARTKAAVTNKKVKFNLEGMMGGTDDPSGVIVITRDPLRHAELFSNYLAENGRLIQTGDNSWLSKEEKTFMEEAAQSQKEAATFYKSVRLITPKIKAYTKKFKERVRAKKEKVAPVAQVASETKQAATEGK